jgi:hypothetical protein
MAKKPVKLPVVNTAQSLQVGSYHQSRLQIVQHASGDFASQTQNPLPACTFAIYKGNKENGTKTGALL